MATLRNKRKLAAVTRETHEENLRNGQSRNTSVPRINEEYITQVSEQIEGRVTKKLSQEFSRTESRILGALSKLDEFLLNQQIRTHSETVPGTFRNTNVENQGTNEDDSQSDPHPEVGPSVCQSRPSIDSDTGEAHDTMTGVTEQTSKGPHKVKSGWKLVMPTLCPPYLKKNTILQESLKESWCSFSGARKLTPKRSTDGKFNFRANLQNGFSANIHWVVDSTLLTPINQVSVGIFETLQNQHTLSSAKYFPRTGILSRKNYKIWNFSHYFRATKNDSTLNMSYTSFEIYLGDRVSYLPLNTKDMKDRQIIVSLFFSLPVAVSSTWVEPIIGVVSMEDYEETAVTALVVAEIIEETEEVITSYGNLVSFLTYSKVKFSSKSIFV